MGRTLEACCNAVKGCCTVDGYDRLVADPAADEALAGLAKALSHPLRVAILRRLAACDTCVCGDIVSDLGHPQSTVSQHLKVLRDAQLVRASEQGKHVCYCIDGDGLRRLRVLLAAL